MNSYKRHVYKTKNPPKPPKPPLSVDWFRSVQVSKTEYCAPIDIQVFKDPSTFPIQVSDTLYTDVSLTTPLNSGGGLANYLVDNAQTQNPTINVTNVTVDGSGVVTEVSTGDCDTYTDVIITNATLSREDACGLTRKVVKVKNEDVNQTTGVILSGAQLYSAPNVPLDTSFIFFTNGVDNFIGIGLDPPFNIGNMSVYNMKIDSMGIVTSPILCP